MDFYTFKTSVVAASGLDKDALHIYVGLGVYLLSLTVLRPIIKRFGTRGIIALILVTITAVAGEYLDNKPVLMDAGLSELSANKVRASIHDIINTSLLPYVLFILTKWTTIFQTMTSPSHVLKKSRPK